MTGPYRHPDDEQMPADLFAGVPNLEEGFGYQEEPLASPADLGLAGDPTFAGFGAPSDGEEFEQTPHQDATPELETAHDPFPPSVLDPGYTGAQSPVAEPAMDAAAPVDPEAEERRERGMRALYGSDFPLLKPAPEDGDWTGWSRALWERHRPGMMKRLHLTERNRLMRRGIQWISAVGFGPWREPPKPRDAARVVYNMIDKALDQRIQIITEQRPGFRTKPTSQDPRAQKRAEAQQLALEYSYDAQHMEDVIREAVYWAGTDGCAFLYAYWDVDAGPWYETDGAPRGNQGDVAQAKAQPEPPAGLPPAPKRFPMGDPRTCVKRIEQVRVSANATATERPYYWIIRETLPTAEAVAMYGDDVADEADVLDAGTGRVMRETTLERMGLELPNETELLTDQDVCERFMVFCEPSEYLNDGLTLIAVGNKVVYVGGLLSGTVPMIRLTDGSSDPSFFPAPIMEGWIDSQMRVNATLSKWVESVRNNAGGRFLARPGALSTETLVGGSLSLIEVKGGSSLADAVQPLDGFSVGADAKELLQLEKKAFEDATGWNDTSRGQFSSDASGRAILAIREQLERVFAPCVNAAARAMTEWGKVTLHWMRFGYDLPRSIAVLGQTRSDLGRVLTAEDFDGVSDVELDPETLMPMPRALRLFLLDQMVDKGAMGLDEYRRRMPFAWTRGLATPDDDQEARAKRVADAIRRTGDPNALGLLWQDNEAIHQDVLERELILPDDTDPRVRGAAIQRWTMLAQQAAMKQGGAPMPQAGAPGQDAGGGGGAGPHSPTGNVQTPGGTVRTQPFLGTNPGVAAGPLGQMMGSDQQAAATQFDRRSAA